MRASLRLDLSHLPALVLPAGERLSADPSRLGTPRPGPELLVHALLGKGTTRAGARVIDLTAGFGGDTFILAAHGLHVTAVEREPALAALLEATLVQARDGSYGEAARVAAQRITLIHTDARDYAASHPAAWRAALVDPMYPETRKTAKANRALEALRALLPVTEHEDADLLAAARHAVTHRAVVKRPAKAPFIGDERPTAQQQGASTRYDIYQPLRSKEE
mgnify:CR=1 FL=1